ncbi:MAG: hypothetical protein ACRC6G_10270 [Deefgea sp.]
MPLKPEQIGTHATDTTPRVLPQLDLAGNRINPNNLPVIYTFKGTNKFAVAPGNLKVTADMLILPTDKPAKKADNNDVPSTPKA